jgi:AcrR family transcriptional regulator
VDRVSPRNTVVGAARTRVAIIEHAVGVASREGLEGITVGRLAGDLGMSKSGLIAPFGSKEGLQLAALEAAVEVFRRQVWEPAAAVEPGLARLRVLMSSWLAYLERPAFPGGCFLMAAAHEFDGRPGPVRDAVRAALRRAIALLERTVREAVEAGDLAPATDPAQLAFELHAITTEANAQHQMTGSNAVFEHARAAVAARLGG